MPTKLITLTQRDQDLLSVALTRAEEWESLMEDIAGRSDQERETTLRIRQLRERIVT